MVADSVIEVGNVDSGSGGVPFLWWSEDSSNSSTGKVSLHVDLHLQQAALLQVAD